jgi:hypothetical protein
MGAYCIRALTPRHTAEVGVWSDYYGAALFGDRREIACIPHQGCRLEIVATAETSHPEVNLLLPGQVLRYKRAFFILDRLELPSGAKVGLWHFVGCKLRLAPGVTRPPPREDIIVERARIESGRQRGGVGGVGRSTVDGGARPGMVASVGSNAAARGAKTC